MVSYFLISFFEIDFQIFICRKSPEIENRRQKVLLWLAPNRRLFAYGNSILHWP